jgi:uncharacterized damage-inducible protein DinB
METFFADYIKVLEQLHTDFKSALQGLPPEALDWKPGSETNSLTVLAVHTAGSERYWVGDVVAEETSNRDRESEFRTQDLSTADLVARLDASLSYIQQVLEKLDMARLNEDRYIARSQRTVSCGWALLHVIEHTAQHTAHAQLTRQLWEQFIPK